MGEDHVLWSRVGQISSQRLFVVKVTIRPYQESDQDDVIRLWEKVFPDSPPHNNPARDIRTKREVQPELFLVALRDEKLVGTAMAGFDGHRGWVYYLGVDPEHQRQGIGTALMRRVEGGLISLGCPKINLQIRGESPDVQAFYEHLGYFPEDRVSMGKNLLRS